MSLVRFAVICDRCQARGPEYGAMIACRECGRDLCEACYAAYDPEVPHQALCADCVTPECACCLLPATYPETADTDALCDDCYERNREWHLSCVEGDACPCVSR